MFSIANKCTCKLNILNKSRLCSNYSLNTIKNLRESEFIGKSSFLLLNQTPHLKTYKRNNQMSSSNPIKAQVKVGQDMSEYPEYFTKLKSSDGKTISLSSFKNKNKVVLFFYPKAETPGCTAEVAKFRDEYDKFKKLGAVVFGISGDTVEAQKNFASSQKLQYPLLADDQNSLRKGFGIKGSLFGALPGRETIVIDKNGKCILSYSNQLAPESHVEKAIEVLESA